MRRRRTEEDVGVPRRGPVLLWIRDGLHRGRNEAAIGIAGKREGMHRRRTEAATGDLPVDDSAAGWRIAGTVDGRYRRGRACAVAAHIGRADEVAAASVDVHHIVLEDASSRQISLELRLLGKETVSGRNGGGGAERSQEQHGDDVDDLDGIHCANEGGGAAKDGGRGGAVVGVVRRSVGGSAWIYIRRTGKEIEARACAGSRLRIQKVCGGPAPCACEHIRSVN